MTKTLTHAFFSTIVAEKTVHFAREERYDDLDGDFEAVEGFLDIKDCETLLVDFLVPVKCVFQDQNR